MRITSQSVSLMLMMVLFSCSRFDKPKDDHPSAQIPPETGRLDAQILKRKQANQAGNSQENTVPVENVDWTLEGLPTPIDSTGNGSFTLSSPTKIPAEAAFTLLSGLDADCMDWSEKELLNFLPTTAPFVWTNLSNGSYSLCVRGGKGAGKVARYSFTVDKEAPDLMVRLYDPSSGNAKSLISENAGIEIRSTRGTLFCVRLGDHLSSAPSLQDSCWQKTPPTSASGSQVTVWVKGFNEKIAFSTKQLPVWAGVKSVSKQSLGAGHLRVEWPPLPAGAAWNRFHIFTSNFGLEIKYTRPAKVITNTAVLHTILAGFPDDANVCVVVRAANETSDDGNLQSKCADTHWALNTEWEDEAFQRNVAERSNFTLQGLTEGEVTTYAGFRSSASEAVARNSRKAISASQQRLKGLALTKQGEMFLTSGDNTILHVVPDQPSGREVFRIAGKEIKGYDGEGPDATQLRMNNPGRIHIPNESGSGTPPFFAYPDSWNNRIRKLTSSGVENPMTLGVRWVSALLVGAPGTEYGSPATLRAGTTSAVFSGGNLHDPPATAWNKDFTQLYFSDSLKDSNGKWENRFYRYEVSSAQVFQIDMTYGLLDGSSPTNTHPTTAQDYSVQDLVISNTGALYVLFRYEGTATHNHFARLHRRSNPSSNAPGDTHARYLGGADYDTSNTPKTYDHGPLPGAIALTAWGTDVYILGNTGSSSYVMKVPDADNCNPSWNSACTKQDRIPEPKPLIVAGTFFDNLTSESRAWKPDGLVTATTRSSGVNPFALHDPQSIAISPDGQHLYYTEGQVGAVRRLSLYGTHRTLTTVFGATQFSERFAENLFLDSPVSIVFDSNDNLFVADSGRHVIWKISRNGSAVRIAGQLDVRGNSIGDGTAASATLGAPNTLAFGPLGDLYFTETGPLGGQSGYLKKIAAVNGQIGPGSTISILLGNENGLTPSAAGETTTNLSLYRLQTPRGLVVGPSGHIYFLEKAGPGVRVRQLSAESTPTLRTVAGNGAWAGVQTGTPTQIQFQFASTLGLSGDGALLIADEWSHKIWKITLSPSTGNSIQATQILGTGAIGYIGNWGALKEVPDPNDPPNTKMVPDTLADGTYVPLKANLNGPKSVVTSPLGKMFWIESYISVLRSWDAGQSNSGVDVESFEDVYPGAFAGDGLPLSQLKLDTPSSLAFDSLGNLYIADRGNNRIRVIRFAQGDFSNGN